MIGQGPRVPVRVGIQRSYTEQMALAGGALQINPVTESGHALIDTGAFMSCIDEDVARKLGLSPIDVVNMTSASHESSEANVYAARLEIVAGQVLEFNLAGILGVNLKKQKLIALIGRDILSRCILIYNGTNGQISLSI